MGSSSLFLLSIPFSQAGKPDYKIVPKPLPQVDPAGGSPSPGAPDGDGPKSKNRTRIEQAIAAGGPLAKTVAEQEAECGEEVVE